MTAVPGRAAELPAPSRAEPSRRQRSSAQPALPAPAGPARPLQRPPRLRPEPPAGDLKVVGGEGGRGPAGAGACPQRRRPPARAPGERRQAARARALRPGQWRRSAGGRGAGSELPPGLVTLALPRLRLGEGFAGVGQSRGGKNFPAAAVGDGSGRYCSPRGARTGPGSRRGRPARSGTGGWALAAEAGRAAACGAFPAPAPRPPGLPSPAALPPLRGSGSAPQLGEEVIPRVRLG